MFSSPSVLRPCRSSLKPAYKLDDNVPIFWVMESDIDKKQIIQVKWLFSNQLIWYSSFHPRIYYWFPLVVNLVELSIRTHNESWSEFTKKSPIQPCMISDYDQMQKLNQPRLMWVFIFNRLTRYRSRQWITGNWVFSFRYFKSNQTL